MAMLVAMVIALAVAQVCAAALVAVGAVLVRSLR
jgi:hypothetical protein